MVNLYDTKGFQALSTASTLVLTNLAALVGFALGLSGGLACLSLFTVSICLITTGSAGAAAVFQVWRKAWIPATLAWIFDVLFAVLVCWEWSQLSHLAPGIRLGVGAGLIAGILVVFGVNLWWWPALVLSCLPLSEASVEVSSESASVDSQTQTGESGFTTHTDWRSRLKLALWRAFAYLPRTGIAVACHLIPLIVLGFAPKLWGVLLAWMLLWGFSVAVYLSMLLIFKPLGLSAWDQDS